ncbi:hypothetical protein [Clostridium celatum]|uniref:hypothetical protein n=1 Tax=Clostridium celatum TaxID=36834 RepID=UPI002913DFEC|nr:hypothetical protein [Clostridium celatum]MDU6297201.1 hypothetical protein [Clostridium celatum]
MWNDICYLGKVVKKENEIGDLVETIIYDDEVYCNEKSIKASEFYQAQSVGMKPELTLEIMLVDYNKEKYVRYDDGFGEEEYTVLRTYKISSEKMQLTLIKGVNSNAITT